MWAGKYTLAPSEERTCFADRTAGPSPTPLGPSFGDHLTSQLRQKKKKKRRAKVTLEDSVWPEEELTFDFLFLVVFAKSWRSLLFLRQLFLPAMQSWRGAGFCSFEAYEVLKKSISNSSFCCLFPHYFLKEEIISSLVYDRSEKKGKIRRTIGNNIVSFQKELWTELVSFFKKPVCCSPDVHLLKYCSLFGGLEGEQEFEVEGGKKVHNVADTSRGWTMGSWLSVVTDKPRRDNGSGKFHLLDSQTCQLARNYVFQS